MTSSSDAAAGAGVDVAKWKPLLGLAALGALVLVGYRAYDARHRASRLEDLLLLANAIESAIADKWQATGRGCSRLLPRTDEGDSAYAARVEACRGALPRLDAAVDTDRLRAGADHLRVCRVYDDERKCEDVEFAKWVNELELERSFRDLLVIDRAGRVLASWRAEPGGISEVLGWEHFDREKPIGEPEPGQQEGIVRTILGRQRPIRAAPELVQVSLAGDDVELVWMNLSLPCEGDACAGLSGAFALAGLTKRRPPGFERHEVLTWHWVALALLVLLPLFAAIRSLQGGDEGFVSDRILIGVVLLMALSLSGLGIASLLVSERRAMLESEKARAKRIRDAMRSEIAARVSAAEHHLELMVAAIAAEPPGGRGTSSPECRFPEEMQVWLKQAGAIVFVVNSAGDQLCLDNTKTRALVNRADRSYFAGSLGIAPHQLAGPFEIVNQQTGAKNWVFGRRLAARPFPPAAAGDRSYLVQPDDRTSRFLFVTLPMPLCAGLEAICLVVEEDGRIVFSEPLAYALSGVDLPDLGADGFVVSGRLGRLPRFTERVGFRRERAVASVATLDPPAARYSAVAVVSMTPRFRSLQHVLLSVAQWLLLVCLAPLGTLLVLSRAAPVELMDELLPRARARERYASGALGLGLLAIGGFAFALVALDPWQQIELAISTAFFAPMLAFALLGGRELRLAWLPRALADPERVFAWYLPFYALATSGFLALAAREQGRSTTTVVLGAIVGPAALAVVWRSRRRVAELVAAAADPVARARGPLALVDWLHANQRRGYVVAVGVVFWFLTCEPVTLVTHAVLEVSSVAEALIDAGPQASTASLSSQAETSAKRASRVLVGGFDEAGERRIAALQSLESRTRPPDWRQREIWPAAATGVALWALATLLWTVVCARTFCWGAEARRADCDPAAGPVLTPAARERRRRLLLAVERRRLPTWRLNEVTVALLSEGKLHNLESFGVTAEGRSWLAEDSPKAQPAEEAPAATAAEAGRKRSVFGLPVWAMALAAVPVVIWLMGQPALLGMVALWSTTLASVFKAVKEKA